MKTSLKRTLTLFLFLSFTLSACNDPLDRIQGEPGEDGIVQEATPDAGEPEGEEELQEGEGH